MVPPFLRLRYPTTLPVGLPSDREVGPAVRGSELTFPCGPVFGTNPPDCIAIRRLFIGKYPSSWGIVMRVLLLRIGALGAVVVLGWIAIANAQRGSNGLAAGESAGDSTVCSDGPSRPSATPPTARRIRCVLRRQPSARSIPPTTEPAARQPAADPFGLQARRGGGSPVPPASPPPARDSIPDASAVGLPAPQRNAAEPSRYPQLAASASAEQPSAVRR